MHDRLQYESDMFTAPEPVLTADSPVLRTHAVRLPARGRSVMVCGVVATVWAVAGFATASTSSGAAAIGTIVLALACAGLTGVGTLWSP